MPAALLRAVFHRPPLGYKMERKNRLKNVAPDDKAAKALLNGRLMDGDFAAWKAKTVTTVQRIEEQIKALKTEHFSVEELARSGPVWRGAIAMIWQNVDANTKKEIQRALWPDGLWYSLSCGSLNHKT